MKRPFEVLILLAVVAMSVAFFRPADKPPEAKPKPASRADLKEPKIGYKLTFNRLRPGMTLEEAEKIFGPPDYERPEASYQQWEKPLTQVHYSPEGVLTEVGGSGYGQLFLGDRVVFRCGQPESDIVKTFGKPLSINDMEYNYEGMMLFCGSAQEDKRWVSAIVLGKHATN